MRLIGISGYMESGKDSAARLASEILTGEGSVETVAFANKMKEFVARSLGIDNYEVIAHEGQMFFGMKNSIKRVNELKSQEIVIFQGREEIHSLTGRQLLQNVGPAARDLIDIDFWVNLVLPIPHYNSLPFDCPSGPAEQKRTDDTNNHNLQEMYPEADVVIVTDVRYDNEAVRIHELGGEIWRVERENTESDGHESEITLEDHIDRYIYNNGSYEDLYIEVKAALQCT